MDKRVIQLAAGIAVVTGLGGLAGAGHDRGVVDLHGHELRPVAETADSNSHDVAKLPAHARAPMIVMHGAHAAFGATN